MLSQSLFIHRKSKNVPPWSLGCFGLGLLDFEPLWILGPIWAVSFLILGILTVTAHMYNNIYCDKDWKG